MAVDKRFWTGVIAVVTVAVAGASALPALLLAPATPDAPPPVLAAVTAEPVPKAPQPVRDVVAERPTPAAAPVEPPRRAEPVPAVEPAPARPIAAAPPAAQPAPAAPPVVAAPQEAASAQSFPPVQPIGVEVVAAKGVPAAAPVPETSRPVSATTKPARSAREAHASHGAKQKRIRPASYPIREFLAWRR